MKLTDGGPKYYKLIGALMDKAEVTHGAKLKSNVCSHSFLQCFSTTTFSPIPYFISRYANSCKSNSELLVACLLLVRTEPLPRPLSRRSRRRATTSRRATRTTSSSSRCLPLSQRLRVQRSRPTKRTRRERAPHRAPPCSATKTSKTSRRESPPPWAGSCRGRR